MKNVYLNACIDCYAKKKSTVFLLLGKNSIQGKEIKAYEEKEEKREEERGRKSYIYFASVLVFSSLL